MDRQTILSLESFITVLRDRKLELHRPKAKLDDHFSACLLTIVYGTEFNYLLSQPIFIKPLLCVRQYSRHLENNHKQNKDMTKILVRGLLYGNIPSQGCMGGYLQLSYTTKSSGLPTPP